MYAIRSYYVVNGGKLVGILSERDYARKVILRGVSSRETLVRDIMSTKVVFVGPELTVEECLAVMTEKRCRHLPVLEEGKVTGLVSIVITSYSIHYTKLYERGTATRKMRSIDRTLIDSVTGIRSPIFSDTCLLV